ncbi:MAG: 23S rRNA (guanosine(2251)-2'-O)-methyltransferase RlmB [Mycoplasmataceae bacterium]|nr:23S rRNA (guanosine(2251)-2'-O)-methyltransferase RlmB [Mycoplasmataceae bacterium]
MENYIYGKNVVKIALDSKKVNIKEIYLSENVSNDFDSKLNVKYVKKSFLDDLTHKANHQGIVAKIEGYNYLGFSDFESKYKDKDQINVAILDQITDAGNFGAIIRSAYSFGVDAIFILDKRQSLVTPVTHKTSAGASLLIDIVKVKNLNNLTSKLKDLGFWIYATDLKTNDYLSDVDFDKKSCVVIGSEGKGVSPLLLKNSDFIFKIKMKNNFDSLNASVAASIIFHHLSK